MTGCTRGGVGTQSHQRAKPPASNLEANITKSGFSAGGFSRRA